MILFFLLVSLAAGVFSRDIGTLSVTIVSSEYGTGLTKVRYDSSMLSEICAAYDVEVRVRFFEGEDFQPIPGEDLEGDLTDVAPGIHTLTWDGSASFSDTYSEETVIRVLATTAKYDLVVNVDPSSGGTATDQTDEGPYEKDEEIDIQAAQNTGYDFTGWQASSGSFADENALETTFTMPDVNATVTATFELIDYTLTLLADPSEGGTFSGDGDYNYNDEVQAEAIPNDGWEFEEWTGDTDYINDTALGTVTVTMPAGNVTLTAKFDMIDYELTLIADPEGGGSVEDVTDDTHYNIGDEVDIKAEANAGWEFVNWSGDYANQLEDASEAETTLTMPADDVNLTANFQLVDYTLTLTANPQEGGNLDGAGIFNFEENVSITATTEEGWEFVNWTDDDNDDAEISTDATHGFNMPAGDVNITANFCQLPGTPEATPTTDVTDNSFTANWEEASGADTYTLEMSLSSDFDPIEETIQVDAEDLSHTFSVIECGAFYYYRVRATNVCGTSNYSNIISHQHTVEVDFTYNGDPVTYGTVYRHGRCWMDRNLGASRVPKASHDTDGFGDLFQWGRSADGHQKRNSGTIETQSSDSNPLHDDFIIEHSNWYNGDNPHPDDLWQEDGTGTNNPCPPDWRVPTRSELDTERVSWESQNPAGAFASPLKWTAAGERCNMNGDVLYQGSKGSYWSSTARIGYNSSWLLDIKEDNAGTYRTGRASGFSVRCVRDLLPTKDD